ncbi:MAG: hypothetical protein EPN85_14935 [Bacteroidetes bacterium]|nr:MAG: hypothetical protein EPN85_14935 [Bacteroidota bacterium]
MKNQNHTPPKSSPKGRTCSTTSLPLRGSWRGCFLLLLLSLPFGESRRGVAQNIGINTTGAAANSSALLDVRNGNLTTGGDTKGLLCPHVALTNITDVTTIATPANGLIVYNTNAAMTNGNGVGLYFYCSSGCTTTGWKFMVAPNNGPGTAGQVLKSNGAGAQLTWQNDNNSGGTVTSVTGTAPIASSGGTTPNITITSPLPIANGGTNITTVGAAGAVIYSNATQHASTAVGNSGEVLISQGAGAPQWQNPSVLSQTLYIVTTRMVYGSPVCPGAPADFCPAGWTIVTSWNDCYRTGYTGAEWIYNNMKQTLCSK